MKIFHNILLNLPEELAHDLVISTLSIPFIKFFLGQKPIVYKRLIQNVYGMEFNNPVGLSAGFDKNAVAINALSKFGFGFIEVGTITPRPQFGNKKPRIFRLSEDQAIINSLGFNNNGMVAAEKNLKTVPTKRNFRLGINIGRNKNSLDAVEDYITLVKNFYLIADYITVNISSPNTPGLRDMQFDQMLVNLIVNCRSVQKSLHSQYGKYTPILVKISPDNSEEQLEKLCGELIKTNIDGIIVSNTTTNQKEYLKCKKKKFPGGLSGKPLFDLSNKTLRSVYKLTKGTIPIIATGGIFSADDALTKIKLGASLVQLYTGLIYQGFGLVNEMNSNLNYFLEQNNISNIKELIGIDNN